ncbi:MAG TPA: AzlC family ABC transporter permease [Xanthobacteraceae bacterium]|nr:AzlC family ABC transporter permease [Xanthobacteraceae bacterium]
MTNPPDSGATPDTDAQEISPRVWFLRGIGAALRSVQGIVLFSGFVGFGGLIRDVGFPLGAALLSTLIVWALPAQVLIVGGFAAGSPVAVIALAVGLSSARFFPMVASLLPVIRGRSGFWTQLTASHLIAVTGWVESFRLMPAVPVNSRMPYFFGLSLVFILASCAGTVLGFYLAGSLPRALANALVFLTPISFLLQLIRNARETVDWLALAFGLMLSPVFALYGGQLDLLWIGLIGGGSAYAIARWRRAKA